MNSAVVGGGGGGDDRPFMCPFRELQSSQIGWELPDRFTLNHDFFKYHAKKNLKTHTVHG